MHEVPMAKIHSKKNGPKRSSSAKLVNGRTSANGRVEGEGSYGATRAYNRNLGCAVVDKRSIARGAERARRALEGLEALAFCDAEKWGKSGSRVVKRGRAERVH